MNVRKRVIVVLGCSILGARMLQSVSSPVCKSMTAYRSSIFLKQVEVMINKFRPMNCRPMARNDHPNGEIKCLQSIESRRIFLNIGLRHIAEILFQDGASIEHFLFRKVNEDVGRGVRRAKIEHPHITVL